MQKNSLLDSFNPEKAKCEICEGYVDKSSLLMNTFCSECFYMFMPSRDIKLARPHYINQDETND